MRCQMLKIYLLLAKPYFNVWDPTEGLEHQESGGKEDWENKVKRLTKYEDKNSAELKMRYGICCLTPNLAV